MAGPRPKWRSCHPHTEMAPEENMSKLFWGYEWLSHLRVGLGLCYSSLWISVQRAWQTGWQRGFLRGPGCPHCLKLVQRLVPAFILLLRWSSQFWLLCLGALGSTFTFGVHSHLKLPPHTRHSQTLRAPESLAFPSQETDSEYVLLDEDN